MCEFPIHKDLHVAKSGAAAADLLVEACKASLESGESPRLEIVRDLAGDLKSSLQETYQPGKQDVTPDLLAEAALRCADLANLAACNVSHLNEEHKPKATAAVHLAAGTTKALGELAGATAAGLPYSGNILKDARSAGWRVDLAVRQVKELVKAH